MIKFFATITFCLCTTFALIAEDQKSKQSSDSKTDKDSDTATEQKKAKSDSDSSKSQYKKNSSPSGLLIGLEEAKSNEGLPANVHELAKEGALASAQKDWPKARDAYQRMVKSAPGNALALANLGIVEYRLKDYKNAIKHLEESVKFSPHISQNWLTLGLSYYYQKQFNLSISALARAKHEDPKDPRTCLYLAVVIRDYGWGQAAETELMRAIALDPDYADAHFNLALLYLERTPAPIEMARRHYFAAIDLGAPRDEEIEKRLKNINDPDAKK
ncbi:MAG: tetratricopeptide repeat protein [Verrucomicrobia bacterium]|nr:tetratricopeptide repeat protein [Verrucomicrobiota bacterium]